MLTLSDLKEDDWTVIGRREPDLNGVPRWSYELDQHEHAWAMNMARAPGGSIIVVQRRVGPVSAETFVQEAKLRRRERR